MDSHVIDRYLTFSQLALGLKDVPRTGWLDRGVEPLQAESVADHSWSVALLAWLLAAEDPALDRERVLQLALVHDLAETITGDLTPYEETDAGRDRAFFQQRLERSEERVRAKHEAEAAAIASLAALLPDAGSGELVALWSEYERRATAEARFVKEVDRLETYLQSLRYLRASPELTMDSFRLEVDAELTHPVLVAMRDAAADRESRFEGGP